MAKHKPTLALITGATSGIGLAIAELLASEGVSLVLCGRRQDRLNALRTKLSDQVPVHTCNFDVRDAQAVQAAIDSLPAAFCHIDVLVNNAGNAHGLAPVEQADIADWDAMIDINVKGLLYVSKAVMPLMLAQQRGHIVNIGSIAGKEVYPNGSVYCASKFAVDALTQGMRMDLFKQGIRVSAVNPGLVETEFSLVRFKGDATRAKQVYQGINPLVAEDIADTVWYVITRPPHVNIAEMLVLPSDQAASTLVNRR
ncbi:SDR family NAD(P)-dependent oxidoreductase [Eisenibacter elegans]|uniref:SDR family NAD(P)-dependent oxidoreductase n=1 Tax=Eisenibacter elegans TaxID=997 RepID=UPI00041170E1|nr:SDR family NAD(P)-dependent oxidoreductase [Eisenibacter elegans]